MDRGKMRGQASPILVIGLIIVFFSAGVGTSAVISDMSRGHSVGKDIYHASDISNKIQNIISQERRWQTEKSMLHTGSRGGFKNYPICGAKNLNDLPWIPEGQIYFWRNIDLANDPNGEICIPSEQDIISGVSYYLTNLYSDFEPSVAEFVAGSIPSAASVPELYSPQYESKITDYTKKSFSVSHYPRGNTQYSFQYPPDSPVLEISQTMYAHNVFPSDFMGLYFSSKEFVETDELKRAVVNLLLRTNWVNLPTLEEDEIKAILNMKGVTKNSKVYPRIKNELFTLLENDFKEYNTFNIKFQNLSYLNLTLSFWNYSSKSNVLKQYVEAECSRFSSKLQCDVDENCVWDENSEECENAFVPSFKQTISGQEIVKYCQNPNRNICMTNAGTVGFSECGLLYNPADCFNLGCHWNNGECKSCEDFTSDNCPIKVDPDCDLDEFDSNNCAVSACHKVDNSCQDANPTCHNCGEWWCYGSLDFENRFDCNKYKGRKEACTQPELKYKCKWDSSTSQCDFIECSMFIDEFSCNQNMGCRYVDGACYSEAGINDYSAQEDTCTYFDEVECPKLRGCEFIQGSGCISVNKKLWMPVGSYGFWCDK